MYKGGSSYTKYSTKYITYAGLIAPLILIGYGLLAIVNKIPLAYPIDNIGLIILALLWLLISLIQFFFGSRSPLDSGLRLTAYHLLAGSFLIFISGVGSPFSAFWILLMLASYIYFSKIGLQLNLLAFIIVTSIDVAIHQGGDPMITIYSLTALITILVTSIIVLGISQSQEIAKKELDNSRASESLQRDRVITIVNNLADAVLSTDMDGIVRVYNASSLNLLDTNENLNGRQIDEVLALTNQQKEPVSLFKEFKKAKTVVKRDDLVYTFSDGEEIRLEVTFSPIRSSFSRSKKAETHDGYIVIARDVTKAKSLEEERDEFINVISHELRTPITIAEGTISNVQVMMGHPDTTDKMLKDGVNLAHDQVMFLANMVNDLSALSRAERGVGEEFEVIDVTEMAHQMLEKYMPDAQAKNLHLDLDLAPSIGKVKTSRLYLEELLQNFITNAIKYTKKGSVKMIFEKNGININFAVKDSGIGISKTDQAKVFEKFYRSEDYRTRETGGTGLGLYVAAKLAHKIGTQVQLTSRLNVGSTFSFLLPEYKEGKEGKELIKEKDTDKDK
ncbi:MAG: ATP-binding protein [Candidatus Saccharibacteria bacterium]